MKRRGFLSLLAMAPAAVPVAAKEAAANMGLLSSTSSASGLGGVVGYSGCAPQPIGSSEAWISGEIKEFFSAERAEGRLRQAQEAARRLDSDLASFRSVSPAWAYGQQVSRECARVERRELSWLRKTADEAGLGWMIPGSGKL